LIIIIIIIIIKQTLAQIKRLITSHLRCIAGQFAQNKNVFSCLLKVWNVSEESVMVEGNEFQAAGQA
jgi:hypothetical protein